MPNPNMQEQIIVIQQQPPAQSFRPGQALKAADLNSVVQATKIANAMNTPRQYIAPAGGKGGGAGAVACKVWVVIETALDANIFDLGLGSGAVDEFSAGGPFLVMARMIIGQPDIVSTDENPIFARPLYPQVAADFAGVSWDRDGDFPVFLVWQTVYGWTLQFGEGEEWISAPQPTDICG